MKYEAVIFDFYQTLTDPIVERLRRGIVQRSAEIVGADRDAFWKEHVASFEDRCKGVLGNFAQSLQTLAVRAGANPSPAQLDAALKQRRTEQASTMQLRPEALEALQTLHSMSVALGVVTDSTADTVDAWKDQPVSQVFDTAVFSCLENTKKPDRHMYLAASSRLGIDPSAALYVGDQEFELDGASKIGMSAVRMLVEQDESRYPTISNLTELPPFVS